jgi:hypothetical protein
MISPILGEQMHLKTGPITFIIFCFIALVFNSSVCFAKDYKWEDISKSFNEKIVISLSVEIEVNIPAVMLEEFDEIPLIIEHDRLGYEMGMVEFAELRINEETDSHSYRFGRGPITRTSRLVIRSKDLRSGKNIFKIVYSSSGNLTMKQMELYELRFDLPPDQISMLLTAKQAPPSKPDKKQNPTDKSFPKITITSHDTSRGLKTVQSDKKVRISGAATDEAGIVEVLVNGKDVIFDKDGSFETDVYLKLGENQVLVSAMNIHQNRSTKSFVITRGEQGADRLKSGTKSSSGRYHALIIGNNDYQFIRKLKTAIKDAKAVEGALKTQYGFETKLIINADRNDILDALNAYRKVLKSEDHFIIYYAGHGEFDETANKAYWLPVDAKSDIDTNWIIVDTVTSNIKRLASTHVLVVSDSCYSGTFTRRAVTDLGTSEKRNLYVRKMRSKKSRTLLASGGNEPVSDIGGEGHSVFAKAFLSGLKKMENREFTAEELYSLHIKEMVAGSSEQTPEYNIIRNSGHEGGDFVFFRIDE